MRNWLVSKELLTCGLLRCPKTDLGEKCHKFANTLRQIIRKSKSEISGIYYKQQFAETQRLIFHQPFYQSDFTYGADLYVARIVSGDDPEWKHWLPQFSFFPNLGRRVRAVWNFSNAARITMLAGLDRVPYKTEWDNIEVERESVTHRLALDFYVIDADQVDDATWNELEKIVKTAELSFTRAAGIERVIRSPDKAQRANVHVYGRIDLRVPKSITIRGQKRAACLQLFEKCLSALRDEIGSPRSIEFHVDLDNSEPLMSHGFRCLERVPPVWTHFVSSWYPGTFNIFETPNNPNVIRAYPLISVETKEWYPSMVFQINLVHVRGETFVECQVYQDKKWLDIISNYFDAPIDIWEGPIESRFGWYGDVSTGRITRHDTDVSVTLPSSDREKTAYVVMPKYLDYIDSFLEDEYRYRDPMAIFRSQEEAEAFGQRDLAAFTEGYLLGAYTGLNEGYDFELLSIESQQAVREIIGFSESDDWQEALGEYCTESGCDVYQLKGRERAKWNKLFKLLNVTTYRVIEVDVANDAAYKKLESHIKAGKFTAKIRQDLAEQFGLTIEKDDYRREQ